jgi:hypothetical protein
MARTALTGDGEIAGCDFDVRFSVGPAYRGSTGASILGTTSRFECHSKPVQRLTAGPPVTGQAVALPWIDYLTNLGFRP